MTMTRLRNWLAGEGGLVLAVGLFAGVAFNVSLHAGLLGVEGLAGGVLAAAMARALV